VPAVTLLGQPLTERTIDPKPGAAAGESGPPPSARTERDDRVLAATRALSLFIAPFLVLGFGILYLFPDDTARLFAWAIRPRMTAMMLGAAYLGGVYFFVRAAFSRRWHEVKAGFIPVAAFAGLLGVTTILHWDRFNHAHVAFWTWAALYFTTPFLVTAAWLVNRRTDPRLPDPQERRLPGPVRSVQRALGAVLVAVGALLFVVPQAAIATWPWALTPFTARVVGTLFVLAGLAQLSVASDARWSAARTTLQSQLLALAGIDLAIVFSWQGFKAPSVLTWCFVAGLLLLLAAIAALLVAMETGSRAVRKAGG
jgi:hypothetical protein